MRCRACKSVNYVRTRLHWWEYALLLCLTRPFRCDGCLERFYSFVWMRSRPRSAHDKKVARAARQTPAKTPAKAPSRVARSG